eukprot:s2253_g6.t6
MVRSSSATVAALARCLIGSHVVLAWSPTASDFAAAALAARSDFRWRAFETSGYRFPDETHFDELDWNTGFAELWLYALRAARLALPESAGGLLRAAKEVRSVRSEKRLHRSFVAAGKAFDRIAEKLRSLVNVTPSVAPATCTPASSTVNRSIRLSNDLQMPVLGLGTTMLNGASGKEAILAALREGYRLIDTAQAYENEAEVGEAILESGIPRSEIFVATKLSEEPRCSGSNFADPCGKLADCSFQRRQTHLDGDCKPGRAKARVRAQLKLLKTSYIDQYMLHGPCPGMVEAWKDLEELYDAGVLRSLGVSNFDYTQLRRFLGQVRIAPHVVQNKFSIYHRGWAPVDPLRDLAEVFRKEGMAVMGYCNLDAYPHVLQPLEDIFVWRIASRCGRTPAQVLLRHALQHGTVVIPKSERPERLRENADIFDFELSPEDMRILDALPMLAHHGREPSYVEDVCSRTSTFVECIETAIHCRPTDRTCTASRPTCFLEAPEKQLALPPVEEAATATAAEPKKPVRLKKQRRKLAKKKGVKAGSLEDVCVEELHKACIGELQAAHADYSERLQAKADLCGVEGVVEQAV